MRPRSRSGRAVAFATLLIAVLLLLGFLAAVGWTGYWVDEVAGGDAGLATSPELEAGRLAVHLLGVALLLLGLGTACMLFVMNRRWHGAPE